MRQGRRWPLPGAIRNTRPSGRGYLFGQPDGRRGIGAGSRHCRHPLGPPHPGTCPPESALPSGRPQLRPLRLFGLLEVEQQRFGRLRGREIEHARLLGAGAVAGLQSHAVQGQGPLGDLQPGAAPFFHGSAA